MRLLLLILLLLGLTTYANSYKQSSNLETDIHILHKDRYTMTEHPTLELHCVGGSACEDPKVYHRLDKVTIEKKDGIWQIDKTSVSIFYNLTDYNITCTDPNSPRTCSMTYKLDLVDRQPGMVFYVVGIPLVIGFVAVSLLIG